MQFFLSQALVSLQGCVANEGLCSLSPQANFYPSPISGLQLGVRTRAGAGNRFFPFSFNGVSHFPLATRFTAPRERSHIEILPEYVIVM